MKLNLVVTCVLLCFCSFCSGGTWKLVTTSIESPRPETRKSSLYFLSTDDANATLIAHIDAPVIMAGLAYSGDGVLYGSATDSRHLYEIDVTTGATRPVGELAVTLPHGLAFDSATEFLFATFGEEDENNLYRVHPDTAATELVGAIPLSFDPEGSSIGALDFHPTTGVLYGAFGGPVLDFGALVTIDTQTADATLVGFTHRLNAIAFHPETGVLYGVDNGGFAGVNSSLYRIDVVTGAATVIGTIPLDNTDGLEFVLVIPEPSGAFLQCVAVIFAVTAVRFRLPERGSWSRPCEAKSEVRLSTN